MWPLSQELVRARTTRLHIALPSLAPLVELPVPVPAELLTPSLFGVEFLRPVLLLGRNSRLSGVDGDGDVARFVDKVDNTVDIEGRGYTEQGEHYFTQVLDGNLLRCSFRLSRFQEYHVFSYGYGFDPYALCCIWDTRGFIRHNHSQVRKASWTC